MPAKCSEAAELIHSRFPGHATHSVLKWLGTPDIVCLLGFSSVLRKDDRELQLPAIWQTTEAGEVCPRTHVQERRA